MTDGKWPTRQQLEAGPILSPKPLRPAQESVCSASAALPSGLASPDTKHTWFFPADLPNIHYEAGQNANEAWWRKLLAPNCRSSHMLLPFAWKTIFTWNKWLTNNQSNLLRLRHMVDSISKMNERNLFSQAKSWIFFFFLQMMNFELSNKIRIPKSGIVLHKLDSFLYLTTLLMMSLVVMLTNVIFWYYIIKYVNIWKICIPQWDHYFPNDWGTVTKSCIGKKDPFKV